MGPPEHRSGPIYCRIPVEETGDAGRSELKLTAAALRSENWSSHELACDDDVEMVMSVV
jgi:hypothetical protein